MERGVRHYIGRDGSNPFGRFFDDLDKHAAARVVIALARLQLGHTGNVKAVGEGVSEYKLDFGPGYRIYFGQDGETLVILLGGGTKARQARDVSDAKLRWADYKARKRGRKISR
jgi:putative addiction module killer protein